MKFSSRPNEMAKTALPAMCSRGPILLLVFSLLTIFGLLSTFGGCPTAVTATTAVPEVRHVRHKRTVSEFVEGLMNAMSFHVDPLPIPSTVIAHITHMPRATNKVYKYVPVHTLKLSKLRARQIAEPKLKLKYPKKFSIKTEDASLTLVKNDLPWTLHPLPPPLPTSKTIRLEVDKSMPWALHPLPPPVKTKNYSDYYWLEAKRQPKYSSKALPQYISKPSKPYYYTDNHEYTGPKTSGDFKPSNYKPVDYKHNDFKNPDYKYVDYKSNDYNPEDERADDYKSDDYKHEDYKSDNYKPEDYKSDDYKHVEYKTIDNKPIDKPADFKSDDFKSDDFKSDDFKSDDFKPDDFKPDDFKPNDFKPNDFKSDNFKSNDFKPDDFKHVDFKHSDFKNIDLHHVDFESPKFKIKYPKHIVDDHEHDNHHHIYHHSFSQDDHSDEINDFPSPSSQSPSAAEFVSHITIEPSIQIASFSETDLQGDGTNKDTMSQGDTKQKCQCIINGHRHKRNADNEWKANNSVAVAAAQSRDSNIGQSSRNSYVTPNVGHATEVQIQKSHDITDQSMINNPVGYVQQVLSLNADPQRPIEMNRGGSKNTNTVFRDESDKFKVDFGRNTNIWNDSKSAANKGLLSSIKSDNDRENIDSDIVFDNVDITEDNDKREGFNIDEFKNRMARKPSQERSYHYTKSKVENSDRGVSFSVKTPFSVSSFSSNIRRPMTEDRQSKFRFNEPKTTQSPLLSSFQSEVSEPLEFEQFGLQSPLIDDKSLESNRPTIHFSRGFNDKPSKTIGQITSHFSENFNDGNNKPSDLSSRLASQFSKDFDDDDDQSNSKPFRYNSNHGSSPSERFNNRFKGSRTSSDESNLEFFQPIVIDFEKNSEDNGFKTFSNNDNENTKLQFIGKTDLTGFSKLKKNRNPDSLRLPSRLHEANENLSRKMLFHPSTFDIEK